MRKQQTFWKSSLSSSMVKRFALALFFFVFMSLLPVLSLAEDHPGRIIISESIETSEKIPIAPAKEVDPSHPKPTDQYLKTLTGSSVNHLSRSYATEDVGISVKVPGGSLSVKTLYDNGIWSAGPAGNGFDGKLSPRGGLDFHTICEEYGTPLISSIIKEGMVTYNLPAENIRKKTEYDANGNILTQTCEYAGEQVYLYEGEKISYLIRATDEGYRWEDKYGNWQLYAGKTEDDTSGRWVARGDRRGMTEQSLYDENNRIIGYADRDGNQVIWMTYNPEGLISAVQDSANRRVEYTYDTNGRLWKIKDVLGDETVYTYNTEDKLIEISYPDGREVHITYNEYGDVSSVLDEQGEGYYFEFDYDTTKKEYYALVRSSSGEIKEIWYDEEGDTKRIDINGTTVQTIQKDDNALVITDEQGLKTRKEYDEWDNLTKVVYPDGSQSTYEYDHTYQQLLRKTERGVVTEYTYNADGKWTKVIEAKGMDTERVREYTYNPAGEKIQMRLTESVGSGLQRVTREDYDSNGFLNRRVEAVDSAFERLTEYSFDDDGNLTTITYHLDDGATVVTTREYDANGKKIKETDPTGRVTQYTYDAEGREKTIQIDGETWQYDYDEKGQISKVTDPSGGIMELTYDAMGSVITETLNGETLATYVYDANNNLLQQTDAAGNLFQFEYNAAGQVTREIDPEGKEVRYEYDAEGRLAKTIDGNGNAILREYGPISVTGAFSCPSCPGNPRLSAGMGGTVRQRLQKVIYPTFTKEFRYDDQGRVSETIYALPSGETSEKSAYDAFGHLTTTTDQQDRTTTYQYDLLGRRISVTDPAGSTQFEYDRWNHLIALTNAKDQTTRAEYDNFGRLTKTIQPLNQTTTYDYDSLGRQWKTTDARNQTTEYVYDQQGYLAQTKYADGKTVTWSYDADGNLAGYADGTTSATYTYNALGQKLTETINYGPFTKTFTYTYYKNGLKKTFTMPDGTMYEYAYGNNNELQEVRIPGLGAITIPDYTWNMPATMIFPGGSKREYEYDPRMRLKQIIVKDPGGNSLLDYQYTYDHVNNILTKTTEHGDYTYEYDNMSRLIRADNPSQADETYTYDAVGNRLTAADVSGTWNYNANNELLGFADVEYEHDENGNMTEIRVGGEVVWMYGYDATNRLVHVEDGTGTISADYYYDPFGRRLWKDVGGVRTYFFYSEEGLMAEYDETGAAIRSYGYKPDSMWTMDPLFLKHGDDYYFYQNDHLGTPQKLVAVNGAVVWSARYMAFGEAMIDVETVTNNLRFPGQYYDAETGLLYNYFRYYDPKIGRYVTRDPLGADPAFLEAEPSLYVFAKSNPLSNVDILGLYGAEVHQRRTEAWARGLGMPGIGAETIAKVNRLVDKGMTDPIWHFTEYAWSWHFDRSAGGLDSREEHVAVNLLLAAVLCNWKDFGNDYAELAAVAMGYALHAFQDWVAHGHFNRRAEAPNISHIGWKIWQRRLYIHNRFTRQPGYGQIRGTMAVDSPNYDAITGWDGDVTPDYGRPTFPYLIHARTTPVNDEVFWAYFREGSYVRINYTRLGTETYLALFMWYVAKYGKPCGECWKWFLPRLPIPE